MLCRRANIHTYMYAYISDIQICTIHYACILTQIYVRIYSCTYTYTYIHIHMYVCIYVCMYVCMYVYMHIYVCTVCICCMYRMYMCVCVCMYVCMYVHAQTHTRIHTYSASQSNIHTCRRTWIHTYISDITYRTKTFCVWTSNLSQQHIPMDHHSRCALIIIHMYVCMYVRVYMCVYVCMYKSQVSHNSTFLRITTQGVH